MLEIRLLGQFELRRDGQPIEMPSRAAQSLLAYLLLNSEFPHRREKLAGVLWPDVPEENARGNLRHALHTVRRALEGGSGGARYLLADDLAIEFDRRSDHWLDVSRLKLKVDEGWSAAELVELVSVYRGELLPGFYEEWVLLEREFLHTLFERKMEALLNRLIREQRWAEILDWGERWVRSGHAPEAAYRALMIAHTGLGDTASLAEVYRRCSEELRRYVEAEPSPQTNELYKRLLKGAPAEGLPAVPLYTPSVTPSAPRAPFQAPGKISYFVGRQELLEALAGQITRAEGGGAIAICGLGGIGKTTVAVELAHALRTNFADGVLWANAATSDPLAILDSWARAFGYDFTSLSDVDSRAAAVRNVLADKRVRVVLDDVTDAQAVRRLQPGGTRSASVLTGRNVEAAAALGARVVQLPLLEPAESRLLLVRILGEPRVAAEETAAAQICELLKHHPLALAIAAQRLVSRPRWLLADLGERLRDEKFRLSELKIGDLEVRASFQVSWRALDEALRHTFTRLGVFEGRAFTGSALAAVAGLDKHLVNDQLSRLVALSCLSEEGEMHYRQHPLLADFARELLEEDMEAYTRLARYYLDFASGRQRRYAELETEWENLSAGMRVAYEQKLWQVVIDYANALEDVWFRRGRFLEARQGCRWACEAAQELQNQPALASCLALWGRACLVQAEYTEAESHLSRSLEVSREAGDREGQAHALNLLGRLKTERAELAAAETYLAESLRLREELGDKRRIAETLRYQARLYRDNSNPLAAEQLLHRALGLELEAGAHSDMIRTLGLLADTYCELDAEAARRLPAESPDRNFLELARSYAQRALDLGEELQDESDLVPVLETFSAILQRQGDLVGARQHTERALSLLRSTGQRNMQAVGWYELSRLEAQLENYPAALHAAQQSLDLCRQIHDAWGTVFVLRHVGEVFSLQGQAEQARAYWQEALDLAHSFSSTHPMMDVLQERLGLDRSVP